MTKEEEERLRTQYQGSAFTSTWADGFCSNRALVMSMERLADAADRCGEEETRTPDLEEAIEYVETRIWGTAPVQRFRRALALPNPGDRVREASAALAAIRKSFGLG